MDVETAARDSLKVFVAVGASLRVLTDASCTPINEVRASRAGFGLVFEASRIAFSSSSFRWSLIAAAAVIG